MESNSKVLIGVITDEYARRADFYDWFNMLEKPSGSLISFCHARSPAKGRNLLVEQALTHDCSHILFIDDDMAYRPNALNQLLEHDASIVTGLYLFRAYPHQPLLFDCFDELGNAHVTSLRNGNRLIEVVAAGLGFCLIKTDVFNRLEKPWFRLGELNSEEWCDDIGFFHRVYKSGFKVFCDTECMVGHMGTMIIWPNMMDGKWMTGYDTNGKSMLNTPQVIPSMEEKKDGIN